VKDYGDGRFCHLLVSQVDEFSGQGFSIVLLEWDAQGFLCCVVNVYSSCSLSEKRALWSNIKNVKLSVACSNCCLLGDFNCVFGHGERKGKSHSKEKLEWKELKDFAQELELYDPP
jgi:hypothetical protein